MKEFFLCDDGGDDYINEGEVMFRNLHVHHICLFCTSLHFELILHLKSATILPKNKTTLSVKDNTGCKITQFGYDYFSNCFG